MSNDALTGEIKRDEKTIILTIGIVFVIGFASGYLWRGFA